jgi:Zn finger protein HypA/HybF involved in hydrogenase expression
MDKPETGRQVGAYNRMMERVRGALEQAEHETLPTLQKSVEHAKSRAVELGELTREEAEEIGHWLRRDLDDAGYYLASTGSELREWFRFDLEQVEARMLELFQHAADRTRLEFLEFENRVMAESEYHTGQVTAPGTLSCEGCGKVLHFHQTGHIPPCPSCHGTRFERVTGEGSGAT